MEATKEKHAFTPGPWHVRLGEDYYHVHGEVQVALVENWTVEDPRGNARLIASAPEMLEALRVCLTELEDWNLTHEASEGQELARELLAKVEGSEG